MNQLCLALFSYLKSFLQVSQQIVLLDEEVKGLKIKHIEADARADQLLADKDSLLRLQEELRGEVQEKVNLLDEFEDKFTRQFRYPACCQEQ